MFRTQYPTLHTKTQATPVSCVAKAEVQYMHGTKMKQCRVKVSERNQRTWVYGAFAKTCFHSSQVHETSLASLEKTLLESAGMSWNMIEKSLDFPATTLITATAVEAGTNHRPTKRPTNQPVKQPDRQPIS